MKKDCWLYKEKINTELHQPIVSVVIPARNEFPNCVHTVQSIINDLSSFLDPEDFEIIICANCCNDWYQEDPRKRAVKGTVEYLATMGGFSRRVIRYLYDPIAGNHSTRNKGARMARGKYLFMSDAHMSYKPGFFKSMINSIEETGGIVHGSISWLGAYPVKRSTGYQYTVKLGDEIRGCVDENTELLTKTGWKKWNEVDLNTEFLTVNTKTKEIETQKPFDLLIKDYNGEMVELKGRSMDALLTPFHRTLYRKYNGNWGIKDAKEIKKFTSLPIGTNGIKKTQSVISDEMVELIGWIICEGCFTDEFIEITQFIEKNRKKIELLLKKLDINYGIHGQRKKDFRIFRKGTRKIKKILPIKELTFDFISQLNRRQLEKLYSVMIDGDGFRIKTNESFIQVNKNTIDAFQYLCILIGKSSKHFVKKPECFKGNHFGKKDINVVSVKKNKYVNHFKVRNVNYKGKVWCPSLKNGTVFARRNGHTFPTGNTWNNYLLAPHTFYIPMQGHCCLGVLREQFLDFGGYPEYHRCYGGGEFYLDSKWWMFGSNVSVDPKAISYHLRSTRGYSYRYDDYIHNVLCIGLALGMDWWAERAYINWSMKRDIDALWEECKKETIADREFIAKRRIKKFDDLLIEKPWDKENDKKWGKHNGSLTIFHETWLNMIKGTRAEKLYQNSELQPKLEKFINENLSQHVYKRGQVQASVQKEVYDK